MYLGELIKTNYYAYVAEIITDPQIIVDKWIVIADIIWDKDGVPVREKYRIFEFETREQALELKVGDKVDERTEFKWNKEGRQSWMDY